MATTTQRVDKDTFKQIFRDHWATFQQHQPRYQDRHVRAVIEKMLSCGTPQGRLVSRRGRPTVSGSSPARGVIRCAVGVAAET
jgi:hypothetical protein